MSSQMLTQIVLPIALALMMFSMGLTLTKGDFRRIAQFPRPVFVGVLMQMLLLPVIAWGLILFCGLWVRITDTLAMGLLILAACPGGATSNIISHLSGGDGALSISMTAIVSLLVPIIVPISLVYQLSWLAEMQAGWSLGRGDESLSLPIVKTAMWS